MAPTGPACIKHERLEWPLPTDETQARFRRAMLNSGAKEVEQMLQDGAPLHADYDLGESAGTGNALDLAMHSKRFKLAEKLLQLEEEGVQLARGSARAVAWAARDGRLGLLQELLGLQADAAQRDEGGTPAVLLAASRGHTDCAEMLLDAGALGSEDAAGVQQLERLECDQLLAKWKAKRDAKALADQQPPEEAAPRWSNTPHARLPWPTEDASDLVGTGGALALEQAVAHGTKQDVLRLLQAGVPVLSECELGETKSTGTLLDLALLRTRFALASQLLATEHGDALARASAHAVAWAARDGRAELLRNILSRGANPAQTDEQGRSALLLAAMRDHGPCVDALVEYGAWSTEPMKDQVRERAAQWRLALPASILEQDGPPLGRPPAALEAAAPSKVPVPPQEAKGAQARKAAAVRWANTPHERLPWYNQGRGEVRDPRGALELAVSSGGRQDVERLLSSGEPLLAECDLGEGLGRGTLLDLAVHGRRFRVALQLLAASDGGDLAQRARWALAWAAQEGQADLVREMLRHKADAAQRDERGRSALLLAAMRGHGRCVEALIESGAWVGEAVPDEVREWARKYRLTLPIDAEGL